MSMQQLSAQDAQFLHLETGNNHAHLMFATIFDPSTAPNGKVRFKDIIRHVESRLDASPVFRRRLMKIPLALDYPYWIEDEYFDLEQHISHARLPDPGDWRQFSIYIARYFSKPMDLNRALWDIMVLEGLDRLPGLAKGCYALIMRVHHCAIDGVSGAHFFTAICDKDAKGTPALELPSTVPDLGDKPGNFDILRRAGISNITSPMKMVRTLVGYSPVLANAVQARFNREAASDAEVPDTRFNAKVSPHKVFDSMMVSLDDMKIVKAKVKGATINDVVLATVSGGLNNYLCHHNELPEQPLAAMVPVNTRTDSGEAENPSNDITSMVVSLPTLTDDPLACLEQVHQATASSKAIKSGVSARLMTDLARHVPGVTMASVMRLVMGMQQSSRLFNVVVSNVPGPRQTLYMCGAKRVADYGMAPIADGAGLFIATPSYAGQMTFNLTSDRDILPDISFLRECLEESFYELLEAAS